MNCEQKKQDKKMRCAHFMEYLRQGQCNKSKKKIDKTSNPTLRLLGV